MNSNVFLSYNVRLLTFSNHLLGKCTSFSWLFSFLNYWFQVILFFQSLKLTNFFTWLYLFLKITSHSVCWSASDLSNIINRSRNLSICLTYFSKKRKFTLKLTIWLFHCTTLCSPSQSHYIEVAQGGVLSRAIHNWFWIFSLFLAKKRFKQNF